MIDMDPEIIRQLLVWAGGVAQGAAGGFIGDSLGRILNRSEIAEEDAKQIRGGNASDNNLREIANLLAKLAQHDSELTEALIQLADKSTDVHNSIANSPGASQQGSFTAINSPGPNILWAPQKNCSTPPLHLQINHCNSSISPGDPFVIRGTIWAEQEGSWTAEIFVAGHFASFSHPRTQRLKVNADNPHLRQKDFNITINLAQDKPIAGQYPLTIVVRPVGHGGASRSIEHVRVQSVPLLRLKSVEASAGNYFLENVGNDSATVEATATGPKSSQVKVTPSSFTIARSTGKNITVSVCRVPVSLRRKSDLPVQLTMTANRKRWVNDIKVPYENFLHYWAIIRTILLAILITAVVYVLWTFIHFIIVNINTIVTWAMIVLIGLIAYALSHLFKSNE